MPELTDQQDDKERLLARLQQLLTHLMPQDGELQTAVPGLRCGRRACVGERCSSLPEPFASLLVQGCKSTCLPGSEPFIYHPGQCLVSAVTAPNEAAFMQCSADKPILYLSINIDYQIINELLTQAPSLGAGGSLGRLCPAVIVDAGSELMLSYLRLLEVSQKPEQAEVLASLILKEIHYYLLLTPARTVLADFALSGVLPHQLARSIEYLKQNYQKSIFVEELADLVHMAPSTFFRHFKALIGLTPMQYHKQLRLYAARKLLWQPGASVSSAAYTVGYESPSQFARDYKKIFGRTPSEEIGLQRQHSSSA